MSTFLTVLLVVYKAILAYLVLLIVWNIFKAKKIADQLCGAILMMPFIFRLLGLK